MRNAWELSAARPQQHDAILTALRANADDLAAIVDAEGLDHLPAGLRLKQFVEVVQAIVAIEKTMEILITLSQRAADYVAPIVNVTGNAERSAQRAEWSALGRFLLAQPLRVWFLKEGFDAARVFIERYASALPTVVDGLKIVAVVVEGPKINDVEGGVERSRRFSELPLLVRGCFHKTSNHSSGAVPPLDARSRIWVIVDRRQHP